MAKLIIRDEPDAVMVLAEALQAHLDDAITQLETEPVLDEIHYTNTGYLLGTLICNPILTNCLGPEPDHLSLRFEAVYQMHHLGEELHPTKFFFDFEA